MAKATRLIGLFFLSVAIFALIGWMAALSPGFSKFAQWGLIFVLVLLIVGAAADDGIYPQLGINQLTYYGLLIAIAFSVGIGGLAGWLSAAV